MKFCASTVGYVRKPEKGSIYIEIKPEYWDATLQLNQFSHIIVIWWITGRDNPTSRANLAGYPPKENAERSGVFATRSPARPTPIGLSIVAIQKIDQKAHRIFIDQIDAYDESPVIDIKPYMPFSDKVDSARVPAWFRNNTPRYTSKPLE
ncbi:MAG: tRNA (N6-threonylcarbamoyladenosine(37)-N6)-methyltransferase TrmO [Promethearchaeota archaeon]